MNNTIKITKILLNQIKYSKMNNEDIESPYYIAKEYFNNFDINTDSKLFDDVVNNLIKSI
jgi:hypothetical protein